VAFASCAASPPVAVAILCLAGISDWLDGWAARHFGQQSRLGALLDPVCDRIFILTVLVTLVLVYGLALWQLAILVLRDLANSAGALVVWVRYRNRLGELRARRSGKVVTSLQILEHRASGPRLPYFSLSLAAVGLASLWALVDYGAAFRRLVGTEKSVSTP
jgi:Phosphatidylglycerophosphate synthase